MPTTQTIFDLIHSLEPSEKRYFSLFANMGGGRNAKSTLEVFSVLEATTQLDPAALPAQFSNPAIAKNFSAVRSRLFDQILRSQGILYDRKTAKAKINRIQREIVFLIDKGFFKEAQKRLKKHQDLANQFEYYNDALQGLEWALQLYIQAPTGPYHEFFAEQQEALDRILLLNREQQHLFLLHQQVRGQLRIRQITPNVQSAFDQLFAQLSPTDQPPQGNTAMLLDANIRGIYYLVQRNSKAAFPWYKKIMDFWEAHPDWIGERSILYLTMFSNALQTYLFEASPAEYLDLLHKSRKLAHGSRNLRIDVKWRSFANESNFTGLYSYFPEFEKFANEVTEFLNGEGNGISGGQKRVLYSNLCTVYFLHGQFRKANEWVFAMLNFPPHTGREDLLDFARVLQLMIQFELGNLDLEAYLRRSARRYFRAREAPPLEQFVLKTLKQVTGLPLEEHASAFEKQKEKMHKELGSPTGRTRAGYHAVEFWLESKSSGTPLANIYAEVIRTNRKTSGME